MFRSNGKEPSGLLFKALSIKYHYKIVVGEVSLADDPNIPSEISIDDATAGSLFYFPSGKQSPAIRYTGQVKRAELFSFLDVQLSGADQPRDKPDALTYTPVKSRKEIDRTCFGSNVPELCLLLVSSGESGSIIESTIKKITESKPSWKRSVTAVHIDASQGGSKILRSLNASNDLPAVVAISAKEMKYALMMQDFSEATLRSFIENVISSKVRFISFKNKGLFVSNSGSEKDEL